MTAPIENTPRTITLALALWALAVACGSAAGIFSGMPDEEVAAIAAFGFVFALGAIYLDRGIRAFVGEIRTGTLVTIAIEADLAIALALMLAVGFADGAIAAGLARLLAGLAVLFAAPVAAALHVVIAERALTPRRPRAAGAAVSSPAATGPV